MVPGVHPGRVAETTAKLWKSLFAFCPLESPGVLS